MNIKNIFALTLVAFGLSGIATADPETGYTLNVSRLTGVVNCSITDATTDKAAFECTLTLKGNKTVGLQMKKAEGGLLRGDKDHGFYGMDTFQDDKVAKRFIVVADNAKAIKFVSFSDVVQATDDVRINVAGSATTAVKAISLNPLQIVTSADKTNIKIGAWFAMYSQDTNVVANAERGMVPTELLTQIQFQLSQLQ